MNSAIAKHDILKQIYELENEFNIHKLDDCQNLIGLLSVFFLEEDLDEDIKVSLGIILQRGRNQLDDILAQEESKEIDGDCGRCCDNDIDQRERLRNDNCLGPEYIDRSNSFTSLLSNRIFNALNPKYHYNIVKKG